MNAATTRMILIAMLMAILGCSKPTDVVIPTDVAAWDKDLAPKLQGLSEEDRKTVAAYLIRAKMGEALGTKAMPVGMTVGQALTEQKSWIEEQRKTEAEAEALKVKLLAERAAVANRIAKVTTVTLIALEHLPKDYEAHRYSETQIIKIGVQNNGDKPIAGVSGEMKFIDIFDKEIGSVNFRITETVEPGKTVTWNGSRDYNQFIDSHRAIWNLEEGKYKTRFAPDTVVFVDGTKLGTSN